MAGAIRGITVEIGGDTTKLGKALANVNVTAKGLQSELKGVNTLLKFDPTNVTLLKQKQDLLNTSISNTKEKLNTLKTAQAQVQEQFDKGDITEEQYRDFQREIVATEQKLKSLEDEARNFGSVGAQQIAAVGEKMIDLGGKIEEAGKKFAPFSTTAAGVLTGSAVLASNFEDAVAKVGTVADTSSVSLETLSADMLALSTQTGKSANEIADATYQAISASVDTADAVSFVETATSLAKAGFLETSDAVDVLTTIINAYGLSAEDAASLSDKLIQTQNDGKTTVNELSSSLGQVIPLASAYGVNIDNLCASYAQLTKNGVATAQAGTYLKSMLNELGDSGSTVSTILQEKTGKSFGQLMADGNSLGDILGILQDSVEGDSEAFAGLWSSAEAGTGALSLTSAGVDAFNAELGNMGDSLGNTSDALETLDTSSAKSQRAINALKNTGIQLGQTVLSAVTPLIEKLSVAMQNLSTWFGNLNPKVQQAIVVILAVVAAIAPVLIVVGKVISAIGIILTIIPKVQAAITAIKGAMTALNAVMAANPIALIIIAITALVAAFIYLWNNCEEFRNFWINLWNKVKEIAVSVWETLTSFFSSVWEGIKNTAETVFNAISDFFTSVWDGIKTAIETVLTVISNIITTYFNIYRTIIETVVNVISTVISTVFNAIKNAISNIFNRIQVIVTTAFTAYQTIISTICQAVKSAITFVFNSIKNTVTTILTALKNTITTIWNGIKTVVTTVINAIKTVIITVFTTIKTTITTIVNAIKTTIETVWNGIKTAISTITNGVKSVVTTGFNAIKSGITTAVNGAKSAATTAFNAIKSGISTALTTAKSTATTISNGIKSAMSTAWNSAKTATVTTFNSIASGMKSALTAGKSGITSACSSILSGMTNIFSNVKSTFSSIGSNVIEGIKSGITGAVSGLYNSIKNALSGLVDKAKDALGIKSPSRVMRDQVGKFIPSGVAAGIDQNEKTLTASVGNMVNRTVSAAKSALDKVDTSLGSTIVTGVPGMTGNTTSNVTTISNKVEIHADSVDRENVGEICDEINRRLGLAY